MAENLKSGEKTNVMRILDSRKIPYDYYTYQPDPGLTGAQIAGLLNKEAGISSFQAMNQLKTGYVHGGCSPIGMKKAFPVFLHSTAESLDRICVSAGKVGWQIELKPADLQRVVSYRSADLV